MTTNTNVQGEKKKLSTLEETIESFALIKRSKFFSKDSWMKDREFLYDKVNDYIHLVYNLKVGTPVPLSEVQSSLNLDADQVHVLVYVMTFGYFTNPSCGMLNLQFEGHDGVVLPDDLVHEFIRNNVPAYPKNESDNESQEESKTENVLVFEGKEYHAKDIKIELYRNSRM